MAKIRLRHKENISKDVTIIRSEKTTAVRKKLKIAAISLIISVCLNLYLLYINNFI